MRIIRNLIYIPIFWSICESAFAQNISASGPVTLPAPPASVYTVPAGKAVTVTSSQYVDLLPGTDLEQGSDVLVKIGAVLESERLSIVFADPGFGVNHDYSPWLNDSNDDQVQLPADANNAKYIDVKLYFEKKSELTKVLLFDAAGSIAHPVSIYAFNGIQQTLVGTFDGTANVTLNADPAVRADGLIIRKFGNDIPVKIQAFGRHVTDGTVKAQVSLNLVSNSNASCKYDQNGKITVLADGGNVVYQSVFDGEISVRGDKIYHYSLDGITFKKSGSFNNLPAGNYTIYARDAFNITAQLTVQIGEPEALSIAQSITQANCYGNCSGEIALTVSGGTAPYSYNWISRPAFGNNAKVTGLCVGGYDVIVTDAKGCTLQKHFDLDEPQEIMISGIADKVLCQNQSVQFNAGNPGSSYVWSSSNGFSSSQQTVTLNQAGSYSLTVTNSKGCTKTAAFTVGVNHYAFKADFIVSSAVNAGDSVYVIDVTKPVPASVNWTLPANVREIQSNGGGTIKQVVFDNPGSYNVTMAVSYGGCTDMVTRTIQVFEKQAKKAVNDALGYTEELVKKIGIYPNPSSGQFTAGIELSANENVKVSLKSFVSNQLVEMKEDYGKASYKIPFNHPELSPGIYFVIVETGTMVKTLKLIKL